MAREVKTICVVGAGNIGHQIALQGAVCGFQVFCTDIDEAVLKQASEFADSWLAGRVKKGKMKPEEADAVRPRISFVSDLTQAAKDADLVIEAIIEKLDIKRDLFKKLDEICPPHTILATNSSYLVSSKIAHVTSRPDKVLNMHFFNPALVMKLVEIVYGDHVSQETVEIATDVAKAMKKSPTMVKKEIYGFVVNRVYRSIIKEACYLLEQDVASLEDIDNAVRNGLGHPLGPFQLMDLVGIDLEYLSQCELYKSTGSKLDAPSLALAERFFQGRYGKKNGKGFYDYDE